MQRIKQAKKRRIEIAPTMSDKTLLLEVEDLIALSFGGHGTNMVNLKMLESVLRILTRHMRLLEQDVEIRLEEEKEFLEEKAEKRLMLQKELRSQKEAEAEAEAVGEEKPAKAGNKQKGNQKDKKPEPGPEKAEEKPAKGETKKDKEKDIGKKKDKKADTEDAERKGKKKVAGLKVTEVLTEGKQSRLVVEIDDEVQEVHPPRIGKIDVVTQEEFDALQSLVDRMLSKLKPATLPTMPGDLQSDLLEGSATLPSVMAKLQVGSRVQATEKALTSMAGLLTQLAIIGALPEGVAADFVKMRAELKNWGIDLSDVENGAALKVKQSRQLKAAAHKSIVPKQQVKETKSVAKPSVKKEEKPVEVPNDALTQPDLDQILKELTRELLEEIATMTAKCTNAENSHLAKQQKDMKFVSRIENLRTTTTEHLEELSGFGTGVTDRMQSFSEQLQTLQAHLEESLKRLNVCDVNTEALAAAELRKAHEVLSLEMERVLHAHSALTGFQEKIGADLKVLVTNTEMLREQKATQLELMDGLKNKANVDALDGLLSEQQLKQSCDELDAKLDECYDVFKKQDIYWMGILHDLEAVSGTKADFTQLFGLKEEASRHLTDINNTIAELALCMGDPQVAKLTRKLAVNAHCGACKVPALMSPYDKNHLKPPSLVSFPDHNARTIIPPVPSFTTMKIPPPPDLRDHVSLRWAGGSHTLIPGKFPQEVAKVEAEKTRTIRTLGFGVDGRLYKMEVKVEPCKCCLEDTPVNSGPPTTPEVRFDEATLH